MKLVDLKLNLELNKLNLLNKIVIRIKLEMEDKVKCRKDKY